MEAGAALVPLSCYTCSYSGSFKWGVSANSITLLSYTASSTTTAALVATAAATRSSGICTTIIMAAATAATSYWYAGKYAISAVGP
jgi:hypothetical protein